MTNRSIFISFFNIFLCSIRLVTFADEPVSGHFRNLICELQTINCFRDYCCIIESINTEFSSELQQYKDSVNKSLIVWHGKTQNKDYDITFSITLKQDSVKWNISFYFVNQDRILLSELEDAFGKATLEKWSMNIKSGHYVTFKNNQMLNAHTFTIIGQTGNFNKAGQLEMTSVSIQCAFNRDQEP